MTTMINQDSIKTPPPKNTASKYTPPGAPPRKTKTRKLPGTVIRKLVF